MAAAPDGPGRHHRHDRRSGRGPPPPANPNALVRTQPSTQDASAGKVNQGGHYDGRSPTAVRLGQAGTARQRRGQHLYFEHAAPHVLAPSSAVTDS